jgi:hypothetical protein
MTIAMVGLILSLTSVVPTDTWTAPRVSVPRNGPHVEVWTSGELFERGDRVHVWFRSLEEAFVTVLRIDTDGRIRVLYPHQPWYNNYVPAGHQLEVSNPGYGHQPHAFTIDDYPGTGYILAVASHVPFDYGLFVDGDHWDYRNIAYYGRVTGDPYVALMDLIDHMLPIAGNNGYAFDVYPYHVDQRYDYPRFICYDCHSYVAYPAWDPYLHSCARFRLVVYNDPYYYPARVYGGTRVVSARPRRVEARYVFKNRRTGESFLTRIPARPVNPSNRRPAARGASPTDIGGVGRVSAPVRRTAPTGETAKRRVASDDTPLGQDRRSLEHQETPARPQVRLRPTLERRKPERSEAKGPALRTPARSPAAETKTPQAASEKRRKGEARKKDSVSKPGRPEVAPPRAAAPKVRTLPKKKRIRPRGGGE